MHERGFNDCLRLVGRLSSECSRLPTAANISQAQKFSLLVCLISLRRLSLNFCTFPSFNFLICLSLVLFIAAKSPAMSPAPPQCAKCTKVGTSACSGCHLVHYCGRDCQRSDWASHKKWCRSPLIKTSWRPQWAIERRMPEFVSDERAPLPPVEKKFLWGNVPAYDSLNLEQNEGLQWDRGLHMLFAGEYCLSIA